MKWYKTQPNQNQKAHILYTYGNFIFGYRISVLDVANNK